MAKAQLVCNAVKRGDFKEALVLFSSFHRSSNFPGGDYTFSAAIKACARLPNFSCGATIHALARKLCLFPADVYLHTALIDLYCRKGGDFSDARDLFDEIPTKNVVSWNALLSGLLRSGLLDDAQKLFDEMPVKDIVSWNAMISGRAKAGDLAGAVEFFEKMPAAYRNPESWNGMISGFASVGNMHSARKLFEEMPDRTLVSFVSMIGGYARTGDVSAAEILFDGMPYRSTAVWNALLSCYAQNGRPREAISLFLKMQKTHIFTGQCQPDVKTFTCLLSACSQLGDLRLSRWVETHLSAAAVPLDDHLRTALIDLLSKCGDIDKAFHLFLSLSHRDVVSYSAMILGSGINGKSSEAITLYQEMVEKDRIPPNDITFVGLLAAYSHAGLIEEGCQCFASMETDHGISPTADHYASLVDLFGRAGRLEEAYEVAERMPVAAHSGVWGALLLACRLHGNVELGEVAARRYGELEPGLNVHLVILANIYADGGRWEEARSLWTAMEDSRVAKIRGCSWSQPF